MCDAFYAKHVNLFGFIIARWVGIHARRVSWHASRGSVGVVWRMAVGRRLEMVSSGQRWRRRRVLKRHSLALDSHLDMRACECGVNVRPILVRFPPFMGGLVAFIMGPPPAGVHPHPRWA